jgi:hypothetical protein
MVLEAVQINGPSLGEGGHHAKDHRTNLKA